MTSARGPFVFRQIPSTAAKEAFAFHVAFPTKGFIWLRSEAELQRYSNDGEVFAVWHAGSAEIVGICYVTLDGDRNRWELGGLSVSSKVQDLGLGTVLARYALARTIAEKSPSLSKQEVIAHVHEDNPDPRSLLRRVGFEQNGQEEAPEWAPIEMKRNAAGKVVGDVFIFPKYKVLELATGLAYDLGHPLRDGISQAAFDFGVFGADNVLAALREAAQ
jgi:ribosomal protein S18 acetylase RimI-like enzyme